MNASGVFLYIAFQLTQFESVDAQFMSKMFVLKLLSLHCSYGAYIVCVCVSLSFQVRKGMARIKVVLGERVSSLIFVHVHVHSSWSV